MFFSADLRTSSGHQTGQNVWCGLPDHVAGGGVIFLHQVHAGSLVQLGKRGLLGGDPLFTAGGCGRPLFPGQPLRHTVSWSQKVCRALSDKALQGDGAF